MIAADRIRFEEAGHRYYLDGRRVPSITQALKPATFDDFDHVNESVLERKREQGVGFHAIVEDVHAGTVDITKYGPELLADLDAFTEWLETSGATIEHSEKIVASLKYRYCGRLDLVLDLPQHGLSMVDIKRTYSIPASVGPQTAGQALAFWETEHSVEEAFAHRMPRACLHIKDGRCTLHMLEDRRDFQTFLAALTVTHWRESHGK